MDWNRRWAKSRFLPTFAWHKAWAENIKKIIEWCVDNKIEYATFWAFRGIGERGFFERAG